MLTTSTDRMAAAVDRHRSGDLDGAARHYDEILADEPTHVGALHLLGLVRLAQGRPVAAAECIELAAAMRPDLAIFRATLAEVYRRTGKLERAIECGREAIELGLDDAVAHNNLGLALHAVGRHAEAAASFQAALKVGGDSAMFHTNLGTALHALGQTDAALDHFSRAVELDPAFGLAHSNLGQLLLDLDRPAEALLHCQEAVARDPVMAEARNNLGNAYRALGRLAEARWCYTEALRLRPKMPQPHASLGLICREEGDWDEAIVSLRRAVELEPNSVAALGLLSEALVEKEMFGEATVCCEKMLSLDPKSAAAHNGLGWLLQEEGRLEQAANHLMQAIVLDPNLAIAHVNLGGVFEKLGDFETAEVSFRSALAGDDARGYALARLALLLRGDLPDADLALIEERIAGPPGSDPARVNLLFGLAVVYDARQRYADAAATARAANDLALARLKQRQLEYDPIAHERLVSGLIDALNPALFARLAGAGLDTRRPVFIVGLPRSGTTLIEQILASHSQFHGCGELPFVRHDFEAVSELLGRAVQSVACIADLTPEVVRRLAEWHLERLRMLDGGRSERIGDKMPDNYLHLGLISLMFPNAVIIHCRRDPRDVALSCWLTGFRSVRFSNDVRHIASRIQQYDRLMTYWRAVLPAPIHEVDYEETVADLAGVAQRVVAACGLEWEPGCLDFHRTTRPVRTASFRQVRQPLYSSSKGRWQHYQHELADLFFELAAIGEKS